MRKRSDLAASTMAEIIIVFIFFFLILLASEDGIKQDPDRPPQPRTVISVSGSSEFFFQSGSAQIPIELISFLRNNAVPAILDEIDSGQLVRPMVEIIGHTDSRPVSSRSSNLDFALPEILECNSPRNGRDCQLLSLRPADNAGLGLARAAATASVLLQDPRLSALPITIYSAGSLSAPDFPSPFAESSESELRSYDEASRRIVIRVVETE